MPQKFPFLPRAEKPHCPRRCLFSQFRRRIWAYVGIFSYICAAYPQREAVYAAFCHIDIHMRKSQTARDFTSFTVREADTLLPFLLKAQAGISRTRAKAILSGGGVRVNRKIVRAFDLGLSPGDCVEISKRKPREELRSKFVKIVYEDRHIFVIEKATGILSMATSHHTFCVKTILDEYLHRTHQKCTAHVVHRLDRDTSGLMIYAKSLEAEQILEHNWHDIVADRRYVALLSGRLPQKSGSVESWLKDNKAFYTYSSPIPDDGRYALTHYRRLRENERYTLAEFRLETGRKNQIRVHSQDLGCPVCGDVKYGDGSNPVGRLALHAYRLYFHHPVTGEFLKFDTPVPHAFEKVFLAPAEQR